MSRKDSRAPLIRYASFEVSFRYASAQELVLAGDLDARFKLMLFR
jgi:hypothetical protein